MATVARFRFSDDQMAEIKAYVEAEAEKYGLMSQQEIRADERERIREALLQEADGYLVTRSDTGEETGALHMLPFFQQIMTNIGLGEETGHE